jgi:hypothetical protein
VDALDGAASSDRFIHKYCYRAVFTNWAS